MEINEAAAVFVFFLRHGIKKLCRIGEVVSQVLGILPVNARIVFFRRNRKRQDFLFVQV